MPSVPPGGTASRAGVHYGDVSIVEDVTDIIYQISPVDTPIFNMSGDSQARAVVHEWQTRDLTTRQPNSAPEGFVYTFTAPLRQTTRSYNVLHIFNEDVRVSGTMQAIGHYAIDSYFDDQAEQKMKELKTHVEHALVLSTLNTGALATNRNLEGLYEALMSGITTYTHMTNATMTETSLNDYIQLNWQAGGEPRDWLMHGRMKRYISSFTAQSTRFISADEQRVVYTVSVYESDFFPINLHLSRDIRAQGVHAGASGYDIMGIDRTMLRKAWLRTMKIERTPKIADSMDAQLYGELTLEWGTPLAHHLVQGALGP